VSTAGRTRSRKHSATTLLSLLEFSPDERALCDSKNVPMLRVCEDVRVSELVREIYRVRAGVRECEPAAQAFSSPQGPAPAP